MKIMALQLYKSNVFKRDSFALAINEIQLQVHTHTQIYIYTRQEGKTYKSEVILLSFT